MKTVIWSSTRSKSWGLDRWTMEIFMEYFDLMGLDLLQVVEDSTIRAMIPRDMNSNFMALIPKKSLTEDFGDFRLISLCNYVYKLIAKIVATRLKPILSRGLSLEQFGFLHNRQILEAVGVAQEVFHSVKLKAMEAGALQLDMNRAYD